MRNPQMLQPQQQVQQPMQMGNIGNMGSITNEQARQQARQLLSSNPNLARQFQSTMQQFGNMSPWDIAYELMRQRGIDPKMMGLPRR